MIARPVAALIVVLGVALLTAALAAVALIDSGGQEQPAEVPALRATETQDAASPSRDDPSEDPGGSNNADLRIPLPHHRPDDEPHVRASEAPVGASADRVSERFSTRVLADDQDVGTTTGRSTNPMPGDREATSLDPGRLADAPEERADERADEDDAATNTEAAQDSAAENDVAAWSSDSATNAEPEQVAAPEDQPTETTSREVESAPSPDSDTGQESLATSGEATVSGGVQRDQHAPDDDEPEAARDPRLADVTRSLAANEGPIHTCEDGDNTRRVWLQNRLVVQPSGIDAGQLVGRRSRRDHRQPKLALRVGAQLRTRWLLAAVLTGCLLLAVEQVAGQSAPDKPVNPSATPGAGSMMLSWSASSDDGAPPHIAPWRQLAPG